RDAAVEQGRPEHHRILATGEATGRSGWLSASHSPLPPIWGVLFVANLGARRPCCAAPKVLAVPSLQVPPKPLPWQSPLRKPYSWRKKQPILNQQTPAPSQPGGHVPPSRRLRIGRWSARCPDR